MMVEKFVMNVERKKKMDNDIYEDLSDGEILDMIFSKFDFDEDDVADPTKQLMSKIDTAMNYKKFLADVLYNIILIFAEYFNIIQHMFAYDRLMFVFTLASMDQVFVHCLFIPSLIHPHYLYIFSQ